MVDTRSAIASRKHTLLHYLTDLLDKEFPDVSGFQKELTGTEPASKGSIIKYLTFFS